MEKALLCPVLCGKSFLPEEEEAVLGSAPPFPGDTDEEEASLLTCTLPFEDEEEAKEEEGEEEEEEGEEALLLSVPSAPEEDELEEGAGTFAALVLLGLSWLLSLSKNFLRASSLGGPLKA